MTKAIETVKLLSIITAIWLILNSGIIPLPSKVQNEIVPVLPWWALVSAGSYALFALGYGVVTLNDKPEKYTELMNQIEEAKTDLKNSGIAL